MSGEATPLRMSADQRASLITYPSDIAVKAMGLADPVCESVAESTEVPVEQASDFRALVESLVLPLIEPDAPTSIDERSSSAGKYLSVSVHFTVTSRGQLEAIYSALHGEPRVLFTL